MEKCWYDPFLGYARWFYQGDEFPVLQCIWPDKEQNYPWSPEFSRGLMWRQPLLFHTDIVKANAEELVRSLSEHDRHFYGESLAEPESSEALERRRTPPASHHKFSPSEWPFGEPENTEAFTTARVIEENHPILLVAHDDDGDWQVLCGTTNAKEQARAVCLGCLYERDKTIGQVADLPRGWEASRRSPHDPWRRSRLTSEPD